MAIMIPSVISPDVKSNAEKHIFQWFQNSPGTEEWIILHSLGISNHNKVIHGEVDFFAIIPEMGIFALEVKGGRVRRENGIWSFTDKYGHTDKREKGPFDQAWDGIFSLKKSIDKLLDQEHINLKKCVFGIGVMFPDIEYKSVGVDQEPWQVFDINDGTDVYSYIKRIADGAKRLWKKTRGEISNDNLPTIEETRYLGDLLRGDFDFVPLLGTQMKYADEELIRLTREQYKCLDQLDDNPRCLIRGSAGTGKTLLAIEAAKKAVASGEQVALFCYNRLLGEWLQDYFEQQSQKIRPLYVGTIHRYMTNIMVALGKELVIPPESEREKFFKEELPTKAKECIKSFPIKFDRIIIDEAQDIINDFYLDFIDTCLSRGLERGKWMMFGDLSMQNIFGVNGSEQNFIDILDERTSFARFRLSINCRNTRKICEEVRTITGVYEKSQYQKIIEGPPVEYRIYQDEEDQRDKLVNILKELNENQVEPGDITILSPKKKENSVSRLLQGIVLQQFCVPKSENLTFSTIQGFKGLENKVIILVDIENFHDKKLMYVGLSRARTCLYVLETRMAKTEYAGLFIKRRL